ncbi:MAG: hypothetical protein M1815_001367 [Lichina confinis]|nr:MAG: hypothetical protein M1815_001367 [Lichina confinis]
MSSVTLKLTTLIIRTLSKPIANQIKAQAREHARFRRLCVSFAQSLHRTDMRLRLGLLRDVSSIDRQAAKETAAEAHVKKIKPDRQTAEAASASKEDALAEKAKPAPKPRIRPLSESKAIDSGANFISEAFLFAVAGSLIVFESLRARRKENTRREDVAERLATLEESEQNARRALAALEKELIAIEAGEKHVVDTHQDAQVKENGMHALMRLQVMLLDLFPGSIAPILPLSSPPSLPLLLQTFLAPIRYSHVAPPAFPTLPTPSLRPDHNTTSNERHLTQHHLSGGPSTHTPPQQLFSSMLKSCIPALSEQTLNILSDVFEDNLAALASTCATERGRAFVKGWIDQPGEAESVIRFFLDEEWE